MTSPRQFHWRGLHVPYIAPWSNEKVRPGRIIKITGIGGSGIGYADEFRPADRRRGHLWVRQSIARGTGTPNLSGVHPLRQRQAMSHMLCQVCGNSTYDDDAFGRWGERHLMIVRSVNGVPIREGEVTTTPPVCEPCALESVHACPHLRKGYTAALVERAQPWGIAGITYDKKTLQPIKANTDDGLAWVRFEDPTIRWTLALRDAASLLGVTPIDLSDLATLRN
ncbi:hypothetical protein ACIREO_22900 [Streptomyces sp. NPDC102441]|uniref:hypothetical protein n=1 Tax=Streptomyces sp. NPDC102441 TaxID=3366176 RepID=UPI0037F101FA